MTLNCCSNLYANSQLLKVSLVIHKFGHQRKELDDLESGREFLELHLAVFIMYEEIQPEKLEGL